MATAASDCYGVAALREALDDRPACTNLLVTLLHVDGVADSLAEFLSGASLAQLAGCCQATWAALDRPSLWMAKAAQTWGGQCSVKHGHPRRAFAQRTVCERWKLPPVDAPEARAPLLATPGSRRAAGAPWVHAKLFCSPDGTMPTEPRVPASGKENVPLQRPDPPPSTPSEGGSSSASARRCADARLRQGLFDLMTSGPDHVTAFPEEPGDLSAWRARVACPADGGVFSGVTFSLSLTFDVGEGGNCDSLPTVRIIEPACFHPNVDSSGLLCAHALAERCSPVDSVRAILGAISALLRRPCFAVAPRNDAAAASWYGCSRHARASWFARAHHLASSRPTATPDASTWRPGLLSPQDAAATNYRASRYVRVTAGGDARPMEVHHDS